MHPICTIFAVEVINRIDKIRSTPRTISTICLRNNQKSTQPHLVRARLLAQLEAAIGYRFRDRRLLFESLIHRSYAAVSRRRGIPDNQRLGFFGDAVLGFVVSNWLLELFPESNEGELSRRKASLVDTATLAGLADSSSWQFSFAESW